MTLGKLNLTSPNIQTRETNVKDDTGIQMREDLDYGYVFWYLKQLLKMTMAKYR